MAASAKFTHTSSNEHLMEDPNMPPDCIVTGDLFKMGGSRGGRKNWNLRKFYLHSHYLSYFDGRRQKGQWDIKGCRARATTESEARRADLEGCTFCVEGAGKLYTMCAASARQKEAWITVINEAIEEFADVREFNRKGETVLVDFLVKKTGMFGFSAPVRLVFTNFPKIMILDPHQCVLKEQRAWDNKTPPKFVKLTNSKWKLQIQGKEYVFEDEANGSAFWGDFLISFQDREVFHPYDEPPQIFQDFKYDFDEEKKSSSN